VEVCCPLFFAKKAGRKLQDIYELLLKTARDNLQEKRFLKSVEGLPSEVGHRLIKSDQMKLVYTMGGDVYYERLSVRNITR
jgi:hypothetical protein